MCYQVLRRHGDIIKRTVGGYIIVQGRADDTMNLGGIKVSHRENAEYKKLLEVSMNLKYLALITWTGCFSDLEFMLLICRQVQ